MNAPLNIPAVTTGGRAASLAEALRLAGNRGECSIPHALIPWRCDVWHGFTDGSATPCPGAISIGGYLVSPDGRITGQFAESCGYGNSYDAEFLAMRRLLERARAAGIRKLILHTDNLGLSKECVEGFSAQLRNKWHITASTLRQGFTQLEFAWIPRSHNTLADWLSRAAMREGGNPLCEPIDLSTPAPGMGAATPCCPIAGPVASAWRISGQPIFPLFPMTPACAAQMGARRVMRLPQPLLGGGQIRDIDDLATLELAASRRERRTARALAGVDSVAYRTALADVLHSVAAGMPFSRFLRQRIVLRKTECHQALGAASASRPRLTGGHHRTGACRPQSARLAHAQALRAGRARQVQVEAVAPGIYLALSSDGHTRYTVDVTAGRCSCPDFQARGHRLQCKHLLAAIACAARPQRITAPA